MNNQPKNRIIFFLLSTGLLKCASFIVLSSAVAFAQVSITDSSTSGNTPAGIAPGSPAGSYSLSGFESVNPYSGKLNFTLPLLSIKGRGGVGYTMSLPIQQNWRINHNSFNPTLPSCQPTSIRCEQYFAEHTYSPIDEWWNGDNLKPGFSPGVMLGRHSGDARRRGPLCNQIPSYDKTLTRLTFIGSDGTEYEFRDTALGGAPYEVQSPCTTQGVSRGNTFVTVDGSAATFISDATIYDDNYISDVINDPFQPSGNLKWSDGTVYRIVNGQVDSITDRNGNRLQMSYTSTNTATDANGRVITFTNSSIAFNGTAGASRQVTVYSDTLSNRLRSGYSITDLHDLFPVNSPSGGAFGDYNPTVISEVKLPDDRSYQFYYNSYGELARVILPTGGEIEYDWQEGNGLIGMGGAEGGEYSVYRRVEKRRVYSHTSLGERLLENEIRFGADTQVTGGTLVSVKTYAYDDGVNDRLVNETRHYYHGSPRPALLRLNPLLDGGWADGREFKTEVYDPNQVLLSRTENLWEYGTPLSNNQNTEINGRITETKTTLGDTSQVIKKTFGYDDFNNQTDVYEYDFDQTTLLRKTHTDFVTDTNYTSHTGAHLRRLPAYTWVSPNISETSKVSATEFKYDETALTIRNNVIGWGDPARSHRGNVTKTKNWLKYGSETVSWLETRAEYDVLGNVVKTFDAKNNYTKIDYTDRFGTPNGEAQGSWDTTNAPSQLSGLNTFAFATKVTNTLEWVTGYSQFDYYTGQVVDAEDINGNVSSVFYTDDLDRPTQGISANNRSGLRSQKTIVYDDANRKVTVTADLFAFDDKLSKAESDYDTLGRTTETRSYRDGGHVTVETKYDALGRAYKQSNPYKATETVYWTIRRFDDAGRLKEVESPDGAKVKTDYHGTRTLVTDQAGKQRISNVNALGQLSDVWEVSAADSSITESITFPNQTFSAGYRTSYTYNLLNNLTIVNSGTAQAYRTFEYDSLSRLKTAFNPESGTINHQYDNNGNLTQKKDARLIETNYTYDNLNRVTLRDYSNLTPDVTYTYDNLMNSKGKLTKVSNANSITEYTEFDQLGRVKKSKQTTDVTPYSEMEYTYNLSGAIVEQKYPSGRIVKNVLDNDGELAVVQSKKNGNTGFWNYADSFTYTSAGAVSSMQLGNGRWESTQFNERLQPTQIGLGTTQNATNLLKLDFTYHTPNNADKNNGNVVSQTITVPTIGTTAGFTATQNYVYDSLNRLSQAAELFTPNGGTQVTSWAQTFDYDRYGNRRFNEQYTTTLAKGCGTLQNPTVCANDIPVLNPLIDTAKNQLQGYTYDAAGNTTKDAQNKKFTYDGENKQTKVETLDQNNVVIATNGEYFYDGDGRRVKKIALVNNQLETTIFVYNTSGQLVAEYSTQTSTPQQVSYLTSDHLGSPRINTDANGTVISRHDYQPFGEEITRTGNSTDNVRKQFTAYERDNESELDFAQARMYSNRLGRFTTADPVMIMKDRFYDPQRWNMYVYTRDNPVRFTDPTGKYTCRDDAKCESASDKAFEAARQRALKSTDKEVRKAAEAYGNPTKDNKVSLGFTNAKSMGGGSVSLGVGSDGKYNGSIVVTLTTSQVSEHEQVVAAIVVHEGKHVADFQKIIKNDYQSKLTHRDTERSAYSVENDYIKADTYDEKTQQSRHNPKWKDNDSIDKNEIDANPLLYPNPDSPLIDTTKIPQKKPNQ